MGSEPGRTENARSGHRVLTRRNGAAHYSLIVRIPGTVGGQGSGGRPGPPLRRWARPRRTGPGALDVDHVSAVRGNGVDRATGRRFGDRPADAAQIDPRGTLAED